MFLVLDGSGPILLGEASVEETRASAELYDNHYVDSPVRRNELAGA